MMNVVKHKKGACFRQNKAVVISRSNKSSCQKWCIKWDMSIAAVTALLVFSALLAMVIYHTIQDKDSEQEQNENSSRMEAKLEQSVINEYSENCIYFNEGITCHFETLSSAIDEINQRHIKDLQELKLVCLYYCNYALEKGWLSSLMPSIQELVLDSGHYFGAQAFSGHPFENLTKLTLKPEQSVSISGDVFAEGPNLTSLEIQCSFHNITIFARALERFANSLISLQIQQCIESEDVLENVTGSNAANLTHLSLLDLRYNTLPTIRASTFKSVVFATQLYLSGSQVMEIEADAFNGFYNLMYLDLARNALETLPEGVFRRFRNGHIDLEGNCWNCNCSLKWLQSLYLAQKSIIARKSFNCSQPCQNCDAQLVTFCEKSTTSQPNSSVTSVVTTTVASSTGNPAIPKPIAISCMQDIYNESRNDDKPGYKVMLRNQTITMDFRQRDDLPLYEILVAGDIDISGYNLLWTSSKKSVNCLTQLQSPLLVEYLDYEETYQFCLIKHNESTVSPYDCTVLQVPPEWGSRIWLPNNVKWIAIASLTSLILATIIITTCLVFFWIRQHPKNQRVNSIILPKKSDWPGSRSQSFNSTSDGYLTPKNQNIYALPVDEKNINYNSQNKPPPLPPNHPHKKKRKAIL